MPMVYLVQLGFFKLWNYGCHSNARNVSFETLYGGKFTLSTQLIILNHPVLLSRQRSTTISYETHPPFMVNTLGVGSVSSHISFSDNNWDIRSSHGLLCSDTEDKRISDQQVV